MYISSTMQSIWRNFIQSLKDPNNSNEITNFSQFKKIMLFFVPHIFIGIAAYLLSTFNITTFIPFAHWLQDIFPPIQFYSEKSDFYLMSLYYFSMNALFFPYYFLLGFIFSHEHYIVQFDTEYISEHITKIKNWLKSIPGWIVLFAAAYFALFINPGMQFEILPVNQKESALVFAGWLLSVSQGGLLLGSFLSLMLMYFLAISKTFSKRENYL